MKRYIILFLILATFQLDFFGQPSDNILTEEQNTQWFASLNDADFQLQIQLIRNRILADTAVYNANQSRSDKINLQNSQKEEKLKELGNISEGRVMYIVGYKNTRFRKGKHMQFWWHNWTPTSEILKFHKFLMPKKISSIETISKKEHAIAIYGSMAAFGVVIIDLKRKNDFKEFLEIQ